MSNLILHTKASLSSHIIIIIIIYIIIVIVVVIIIIIIIVFLGQPGRYEIVNMFADSFFFFFQWLFFFGGLFQGSELGRTNLLPIELRRTTTDMQTT